MVIGSQLEGASGMVSTLEGPTGASQSRMAVLQLLPLLLSVMSPTVFWNQTVALGALSGTSLVYTHRFAAALAISRLLQVTPASKLIC